MTKIPVSGDLICIFQKIYLFLGEKNSWYEVYADGEIGWTLSPGRFKIVQP